MKYYDDNKYSDIPTYYMDTVIFSVLSNGSVNYGDYMNTIFYSSSFYT